MSFTPTRITTQFGVTPGQAVRHIRMKVFYFAKMFMSCVKFDRSKSWTEDDISKNYAQMKLRRRKICYIRNELQHLSFQTSEMKAQISMTMIHGIKLSALAGDRSRSGTKQISESNTSRVSSNMISRHMDIATGLLSPNKPEKR
jgi:hypothetical protein